MRKLTLTGLSILAACGLAACEQSQPAAAPEQTTELPEEPVPAEGAMDAAPADGAMAAEGAMEADPADAAEAPEGAAPSSSGGGTTPPSQ